MGFLASNCSNIALALSPPHRRLGEVLWLNFYATGYIAFTGRTFGGTPQRLCQVERAKRRFGEAST
ncbi:hypothetical protein ACFWWT_47360 [Streptomyces sp. NPDC058676]|uniref:hypothetical protein n=1 Tax=unclassified Streptomyces TaxID=2593676 RepID=UPI003664EDC9